MKADSNEQLLLNLTDGRSWADANRTDWKGYQRTRYKGCAGLTICINPNCLYLVQNGEPKQVNFKKGNMCAYCEDPDDPKPAFFTKCEARKYICTISETEADVYHVGDPTCVPKEISGPPTQLVANALAHDITIKPSKIQGQSIISQLRLKNWEGIDKAVKDATSLRKISNEKIKQLKFTEPDQAFPALRELKDFLDTRDPTLIYKVDEDEQIVFKSSRNQMQREAEMDYRGLHFLAKEYVHFDGNHKRTQLYVTLTASVYHPLLRQQKVLATMQCKHESEKFVTLFWTYFDECFKLVNGYDMPFHPLGFVVDMAGANFSGLSNVFGPEVLETIKGCEVHFRMCYERKRSLMDDDIYSAFIDHCEAVKLAASPVSYQVELVKLVDFVKTKPTLLPLLKWIKWWDDQKHFMFCVFTPLDAPHSNLAEVVHAGWKNRDEVNLSLLHTTFNDVKASLLFNQEMQDQRTGLYDGGNLIAGL